MVDCLFLLNELSIRLNKPDPNQYIILCVLRALRQAQDDNRKDREENTRKEYRRNKTLFYMIVNLN